MRNINWINYLSPDVKKCSLSGGKDKMDISGLNNSPFEELNFSRLNVEDFSDIDDNESLKKLFALEYDGNSLDGIENFKSLESLTLANLHNLSDINALKKCNNLKSLHLIQCEMLNDYSVVTEIPMLNNLYIDNDSLSDEQINLLNEKGVKVVFYDGKGK